jgi:hypothetical protein
MRLFGFVLLVAGLLLCVSIVWAALGFLMMGFGLICLLIAECNRKCAPNPDVSDPVSVPSINAAPRPDKTVARQAPAAFLEPTFAAASPEADFSSQLDISNPLVPEEDRSPPVDGAVVLSRMVNVGDRRAPPPPRTTRSSEFDRIRAWRTERGSVRSEPEFRDFAAPVERAPQPPALLPPHSVSAEPAVRPPITVAPPIITESKAAANEPHPEIVAAKPATLKAERSVLFDDADDLADLFNKFDLGKGEPAG